MKIHNGENAYEIAAITAEMPEYNMYLCLDETGRECLFQIAKCVDANGALQRNAYILMELKRLADETEEEYAKVKADPNARLNYDYGFPELMDSFICHEQGGRQVNVLAFRQVEKVNAMVPLSNITEKDKLRVDIRTSAWILGKLLKILRFTHHQDITVGMLGSNNVLIVPEEHFVTIFDWSAAKVFTTAISMEEKGLEISQAAKSVIVALGGDPETGIIPKDDDPNFSLYTNHLFRLSLGYEQNTKNAHENFYSLIDKFWERKFHEFTAFPIY